MNTVITKYLQGLATDEEKQQLLGWLKESETNKKKFTDLQEIWISSGASLTSESDVSKAFTRFRKNVLAKEKPGKKTFRWPMYKVAASVAMLLCCTWGGYFAGKTKTGNNLAQAKETIINQVIMGNNSKGSVKLPDGTTAWLNENSRLSYPETFRDSERKVKLEGEAYFEVVHNEKSPFYVETKSMTVNVLGTHFDVNSYAGKDFTKTILVSGKVEVLLHGNNEKVVLKPNQMIACNNQTGAYKVSNVDAREHIIWMNDKLVLQNEKLSTILGKMEYWYGIDFECSKNISQSQRLSLTIRKETKEEIMDLLGMIAHVNYRISGDKVIMRSK